MTPKPLFRLLGVQTNHLARRTASIPTESKFEFSFARENTLSKFVSTTTTLFAKSVINNANIQLTTLALASSTTRRSTFSFQVQREYSNIFSQPTAHCVSSGLLITSHPTAGDLYLSSAPHLKLVGTTRSVPSSCWMHNHYCVRNISTRRGTKRSVTHFYDVLGLTPKATQNQIKSAYYEKSKLHHPDVSKGAGAEESHIKFTEVSEAYEVLGNVKKRRMYDMGFKVHQPPQGRETDFTGDSRDYQKNSPFERGSRPPPPRGHTNMYNFDEFYRQHYNDIRERRHREQRAYEEHMDLGGRNPNGKQTGLYLGVFLPFWLCFLAIWLSNHENRDRNRLDFDYVANRRIQMHDGRLENIPVDKTGK